MTERVVVVEQTAKRWKGLRAIGCLGMVVGFFAVGLGAPVFGILLLVLGLGAYVVSRLGAWWHHG